jgi:hypothetical protein
MRSRVGGDFHPKTWKLEGSMDGINWMELDSQVDRTELVGNGLIATFPCSGDAFVQKVRILMTGKAAVATITSL